MGDTTRIPIRQVGVTSPSAVKHAEHFYRRVPVAKPTYENDAGDLLPTPKKIGSLTVGMADAEKLAIAVEESATVSYEPTERPEIRFRGKLAVSELEASMTVAAAERTEEVAVVAKEEVATAKEADIEESGADANGEALAEEVVAAEAVREDGVHGLAVAHLRGRAKMHKS